MLKKFGRFVVQAVLPTLFLVWIVRQIGADERLVETVAHSFRFERVVVAFGCYLAAMLASFWRWHILNRIQGFNGSFRKTARIAFYGFLCRMVPVGGYVAGDAFRVWRLIRDDSSRKAEAFASVVADRFLSLYGLFATAAFVALAGGYYSQSGEFLRRSIEFSFVATGAGAVFALVTFLGKEPSQNAPSFWDKIPKIGGALKKTAIAFRHFRGRERVGALTTAFIATLTTDVLFGLSFYFIALGLFGDVPSLGKHMFATQIGFASGMIPVSVGPFELIFDRFYAEANYGEATATGGALIVFIYRAFPPLLTVLGVVAFGFRADALRDMFPPPDVRKTLFDVDAKNEVAADAKNDTTERKSKTE